jgi:hypothetical protein
MSDDQTEVAGQLGGIITEDDQGERDNFEEIGHARRGRFTGAWQCEMPVAFPMRRASIAHFIAMVMMMVMVMMVVEMMPDSKRFAASITRFSASRRIPIIAGVFDEMQVRAMVRVMVMKESSWPPAAGV